MRVYRDQSAARGYPPLLAAAILSQVIAWWRVFPQPMAAFMWLLYGVMLTVPYVADRLLAHRIGGFGGTLVYPLAATAWEFVNLELISPLGNWGATGYSQYGVLPLMQLLSLTGMAGLTFVMGWFASVANWAWEERGHGQAIRSGLAVYASVLAAVLIFGSVRLATAPRPTATVRVAGVTAQPVKEILGEWTSSLLDAESARAEVAPMRAAYLAATEREAVAGAQAVIWPEIAGLGYAADEAGLISRGREVARQQGIYLAMPLFTLYPNEERKAVNKLLVFDPSGGIVLEHYKYGGAMLEGTQAGDRRLHTVETPFGLLSGVLCWDTEYPAVLRQAGRAGVGLLLAPSSDWPAITPVHAHMAVFRAVENGFALIRQTDNGLSLATDEYGRVLAQMDHFAATDRTLVAQVPTQPVRTLYAVAGPWFGWLTVAGVAALVAWGIVAGRREPGFSRGEAKRDGRHERSS
jgi:apolipoprotein N-acyltransferase